MNTAGDKKHKQTSYMCVLGVTCSGEALRRTEEEKENEFNSVTDTSMVLQCLLLVDVLSQWCSGSFSLDVSGY